jgi:hypothetical protein
MSEQPQHNLCLECPWQTEKPHIMNAISGLRSTVEKIEEKLDERHQDLSDKLGALVTSVAQSSSQRAKVDDLERSMTSSREDIAALKVKASLIGLMSAAILEVIFLAVKQFK